MRFLMTVNGGGRPPDEQLYAEMGRFVEELTRAGVLLATGGLDRGTHVTASGGNITLTDGPFTESKEVIVSFALLEVRSKDEALELARRFWKIVGRRRGRHPPGVRPRGLVTPATGTAAAHRAVEAVWRLESARIIAGLAGLVRDVGLAEELAQDALVAALEQWPAEGIPANPGAWLMLTARHRAIDRIRRNERLGGKLSLLGRELETAQHDRPGGVRRRPGRGRGSTTTCCG